MTINPTKYVRKPVVVEAIRVTEDNFFEVAMWCGGDAIIDNFPQGVNERHIRVRVHSPQSERQKRAHIGDWILYANRGYKIYTDKAFKNSFEIEPTAELREAWDKFQSEFAEAGRNAMTEMRRSIDEAMVTGNAKKHFRSTSKPN